jgi:hypothetical protein
MIALLTITGIFSVLHLISCAMVIRDYWKKTPGPLSVKLFVSTCFLVIGPMFILSKAVKHTK